MTHAGGYRRFVRALGRYGDSIALVVLCGACAFAADGGAKPTAEALHPNDTLTAAPERRTESQRREQQRALDAAREAAANRPDSATAQRRLAVLAARQALWLEAVEHLRQALRLDPDDAATANRLAWIWAVCPSADFRSGAEAVELAERWRQRTGGENATLLDTLAAAFAEQGRFEEAVAAAEVAVSRAQQIGRESEAQQIAARLELYRQGQPYRP